MELQKNVTIKMDRQGYSPLLAELWHRFTGEQGDLTYAPGEKNTLLLGNCSPLPLVAGDEFTLRITDSGIAISGKDRNGLLHGYSALLLRLETPEAGLITTENVEVHGRFRFTERIIHLCVFPETSPQYLRSTIRLCGILQYTHIVLEFWGTLRLDAMPELSWPCAYSKDSVRELIDDIRSLGMEPIPMFNHLGHAAGSRIRTGKHVVLDQNPTLQPLFSPDGWAWSLTNAAVPELLRKVRKEVYELYGESRYLHIGWDEAFIYNNGYVPTEKLAKLLRSQIEEVLAEGRTPMLWGDMLLSKEEINDPACCCNAKNSENSRLLRDAAKGAVICDWQYDVQTAPVASTVFLNRHGCEVVPCCWYDKMDLAACVKTAEQLDCGRVFLTTWHTLQQKMPTILRFAEEFGLSLPRWMQYAHISAATGTILRKTAAPRPYEEAGFCSRQTALWN